MTEATKPNFKKTLNLPKTAFPMRANLRQNELASEKRWEGEGLYTSWTAARSASTPVCFHDWPP